MQSFKGRGISNGVGDGLLYKFSIEQNVKSENTVNLQDEIEKFNEAILFLSETVQSEYEDTQNKKRTETLQNRLNLLQNDDFLKSVQDVITQKKVTAQSAILQFCKQCIQQENYFKTSKDDIYQVAYIAAYYISGKNFCAKVLNQTTRIVMATNLPIYNFMFEEIKHKLSGIIMCENCTDTVASDLARNENISVVVLSEEDFKKLCEDERTVTNASSGQVIQQPDSEELSGLAQKRLQYINSTRKNQLLQGIDTITQHGVRVNLTAEIVFKQHARTAVDFDASAVGLLKSDVIKYSATKHLTETELYSMYRDMFILMGDKSVTIMVNAKGKNSEEKYKISHITKTYSCFAFPDIIFGCEKCWSEKNMRAILKASPYGKPKLLLNGVQSEQDVKEYKKELAKQTQILRKENKIVSENISVGVLINTPVTAAIADIIAEECDFLCIDVNSLANNIFYSSSTANRQNNGEIINHPAVMRTIAQIVRMAQHVNKKTLICGYNIFDVEKAAFFMGLRISEICALPNEIPAIKKKIRTLTREECKSAMVKYLQLPK